MISFDPLINMRGRNHFIKGFGRGLTFSAHVKSVLPFHLFNSCINFNLEYSFVRKNDLSRLRAGCIHRKHEMRQFLKILGD